MNTTTLIPRCAAVPHRGASCRACCDHGRKHLLCRGNRGCCSHSHGESIDIYGICVRGQPEAGVECVASKENLVGREFVSPPHPATPWPLQDVVFLRGSCAQVNHRVNPTPLLYTIHHTILVMAISCLGQAIRWMPFLTGKYLEKKTRRCFAYFRARSFSFARVNPRLTRRLG